MTINKFFTNMKCKDLWSIQCMLRILCWVTIMNIINSVGISMECCALQSTHAYLDIPFKCNAYRHKHGMLCHAIDTCISWHSIHMQCLYNTLTIFVGSQEFMFLIVLVTHFCLHNTRSLENLGFVLLCTINAIQLFFFLKNDFPLWFSIFF